MAEISEALTERMLERLGFSQRPPLDLAGLTALYDAWCRHVPFDNVRKRIHVAARNPASLPGDSPHDLIEGFLEFGVGGTCWSLHGGLTAFFAACGFDARRAVGTMMVAPNLPPNHGSAVVLLDGKTFLVDGCMQHGVPIELKSGEATEVNHPAWGVRVRPDGVKWLVWWRLPMAPDGFDCRIDSLEGDIASFRQYHENSRTWSPFNFQLSVRLLRGDGVIGLSQGHRADIQADGSIHTTPLDHAGRIAFLVGELGVTEWFAAAIPEDVPTPPPPGSATAGRAANRR